MFINLEYLIFVFPAMLIGLIAQIAVKSRYAKYSRIAASHGFTGAAAAKAVLDGAGVSVSGIGRISGEMTDYYDPKSNRIMLSEGVYSGNSIAAVGIAAHEAGHALQYAENYAPIKLRNGIIPVCNFGSRFGILLIVAGFFISYASEALIGIANFIYLAGVILYSTVALFQLITLPVEINASRRAVRALENACVLEKSELPGVKSMLSAAALTYVAALLTSVMTLFYYISRFKPRD